MIQVRVRSEKDTESYILNLNQRWSSLLTFCTPWSSFHPIKNSTIHLYQQVSPNPLAALEPGSSSHHFRVTGHCSRHFSTEAFLNHKLMFKFKTSHSCSTSKYSPHILCFDKFSLCCLSFSWSLHPAFHLTTVYTRLLTPFIDTPHEQKNLLISVPIFQTPENHKFHSIILCLVQFWKGSIYFTPILLAHCQYVSNNGNSEIYSFSSKHMASILKDRAHFLTKTCSKILWCTSFIESWWVSHGLRAMHMLTLERCSSSFVSMA